jgi:hypothetical protein
MIICLGPICFPIWHLLPILLFVFNYFKKWFCKLVGIELAEEPEKKLEDKKNDGEQEAVEGADAPNGDAGEAAPGLRRRNNGGGVTKVESVEHWRRLQEVCALCSIILLICSLGGRTPASDPPSGRAGNLLSSACSRA